MSKMSRTTQARGTHRRMSYLKLISRRENIFGPVLFSKSYP